MSRRLLALLTALLHLAAILPAHAGAGGDLTAWADGKLQILASKTEEKASPTGEFTSDKAIGLAGRSVVQATVEKTLFGTDFKEGFANALVSDLAAGTAYDIGSTWGTGDTKKPAMHILAHAGLGATAAQLTGKDPVAGALGGLTAGVIENAIPEGSINPNNLNDRIQVIAGSSLASGIIAKMLGKDETVAMGATKNAIENNYLSPKQQDRFKAALADCKGDPNCITSRVQEYQDLSYRQGGLDTPEQQQAWENSVANYYNQHIGPLCNGNADCIQNTATLTRYLSIVNAGSTENMAYALEPIKADLLDTQGRNISAFFVRYGELISVVTAVLPGLSGGFKAGAGAASAPKGGIGAVEIGAGKFDYLFGRVTSNSHNASRSQQLQSELSHIGIYDTPSGRATLTNHFSDVASNPSSVVRTFSETRNGVTQNFSVRDSVLSGPGGFVRLETTFETMADGTSRFITTIPYR